MYRTDLDLKAKGNANIFKSTQVLDQVRREAIAMQDMHTKDMDDQKLKMEKHEQDNAEIFVHNLSLKPFSIFAVSTQQLKLFKKNQKKGRVKFL